MLFAIWCEDRMPSAALRREARPAHLARLEQLVSEGRLRLAGPTPLPGSDTVDGSLIVADFEDLEAAQRWVDADPYCTAGVYERVVIKPFKLVLP